MTASPDAGSQRTPLQLESHVRYLGARTMPGVRHHAVRCGRVRARATFGDTLSYLFWMR
jgi:hypothetical protein